MRPLRLVVFGVFLLSITLASQANADARLTPEQAAAKATFEEDIARELATFEKKCGYALTVTSDFEAFEETAWLATNTRMSSSKRRSAYDAPSNPCRNVIDALGRMCFSEGKPSKHQETIAREVKTLACLFSGYKPKKPDEGSDVHTQRNLQLAKGTFTVHSGLDLGNIDLNVKAVVQRASGGKVGWDLAAGQNGAKCSGWRECDSSVCLAGTCTACSAKAKCQKPGASCSSGTCWTQAEIDAQAESDRDQAASSKQKEPSKQKAAGAARGRMCSRDKDCQSGSCKMENKTRGRCQ